MKIKAKNLFRNITFERDDVDEENRTIKLSFSSESPVERYFGIEILDHNAKSVRLKRLGDSGPLLVEHNRHDHVGVVESVEIGSDKKGHAVVRFGKSERADEIYKDVLDGIRRSVSVRYEIYKMEETKGKPGEMSTFRALDWEPLEISMVAIPADAEVGVGRDEPLDNDIEIEIINSKEEDEKMRNLQNKKKFEADKGIVTGDGNARSKEESAIEMKEAEDKASERALVVERTRSREILALGKEFDKSEEAGAAIDSGLSLSDFRAKILEGMKATPIIVPDPNIGLTDKETEQFSIMRAADSIVTHGDLSGAPFEAECSRAVLEKYKKPPMKRGFSVPYEVSSQKRDLTVAGPAGGGNLVDTTLMIQSFIDMLFNNMIVAQMGATILDGLVGDVAIPRETGGCSHYWLDENGEPSESNPSIDQLGLTPKTIGAYTEISRKLLMQSSLGVENFVRSRLARALGLGLDYAAIMGDGRNRQPRGVIHTTGIGVVRGPANNLGNIPTWGDIVDLESEVAIDNAALGNLGYLTNAKMVGRLKQTEKAEKTAQFIMAGRNKPGFGEMNGYPVGVTNQVPSKFKAGSIADDGVLSAIIFGNWADLIIGYWGAMDVLVDPYSEGLSGKVRIRILRDTDLAISHPQSFAVKKDAKSR